MTDELKARIFTRKYGSNIPEVLGWHPTLQMLDLWLSKKLQTVIGPITLQTKNKGSGAYESYSLTLEVDFTESAEQLSDFLWGFASHYFSAKSFDSAEYQKLSLRYPEKLISERRDLPEHPEVSQGLFDTFVQMDVQGWWLYGVFVLEPLAYPVLERDLLQYRILLIQLMENEANKNVPETLTYIRNQRTFYLIRYRAFLFDLLTRYTKCVFVEDFYKTYGY